MNKKTLCKLKALKVSTWLLTCASQLVYSFHKKFPDIVTIYNIRYMHDKNKYHTMNLYYNRNKAPWITSMRIKQQKQWVQALKTGEIEQRLPARAAGKLQPMVVYFHGGGWACYDKNLYDSLCGRLASMGFVVFNANYTLTPKGNAETIMRDAVQAVNVARKLAPMYNADPNHVVLMGDSAGAHIASLLAGMPLEGENGDLQASIKALALFYGVYDLHSVQYSNFPNLDVYVEALIPHSTPNYAEVLTQYSPVQYVTPNYPPTFLASGEIDKLHETQSKVFAEELQKKNVPVVTKFFPEKELRAVHAYMTFDGLGTNEETLQAAYAFFKAYTIL